MGEQRKGKKGFFWDFYVDFFNDLIKDSQIYEAYSHHIYQPINDNNNKEWLNKNSLQIEKLMFWLETYKHNY